MKKKKGEGIFLIPCYKPILVFQLVSIKWRKVGVCPINGVGCELKCGKRVFFELETDFSWQLNSHDSIPSWELMGDDSFPCGIFSVEPFCLPSLYHNKTIQGLK